MMHGQQNVKNIQCM